VKDCLPLFAVQAHALDASRLHVRPVEPSCRVV
jgi:hypothetical protein